MHLLCGYLAATRATVNTREKDYSYRRRRRRELLPGKVNSTHRYFGRWPPLARATALQLLATRSHKTILKWLFNFYSKLNVLESWKFYPQVSPKCFPEFLDYRLFSNKKRRVLEAAHAAPQPTAVTDGERCSSSCSRRVFNLFGYHSSCFVIVFINFYSRATRFVVLFVL